MRNDNYYSSEFTPLIGAIKLYLLFYEVPDSYGLELYKVFSIYPLLDNKKFLDYVLDRKLTNSFYKIISDYITKEKNGFYIDYSIKYDICKRQCFESIYFALICNILKFEDGKLIKSRILPLDVIADMNGFYKGIMKLGSMILDISYVDLLDILKVGERNG